MVIAQNSHSSTNNMVFCYLAMCRFTGGYVCFKGTCCLNLRVQLLSWTKKQQVPLKHLYLSTKLHVTLQKTVIFNSEFYVLADVRNPKFYYKK